MIAKGETLSEVLNDVNAPVEPPSKVAFLQPRGLVNTGNMCYMNSVSLIKASESPYIDSPGFASLDFLYTILRLSF